MTDQIVDRRQVFLPGPEGPQGKQGEQGLPGVNAVDNDTAVAGYVQAGRSETRAALDRLRPAAGNAVYLGLDPTGREDISAKLNAIVASGAYNTVTFPSGVYKVSAPIRLHDVSLDAAPGARFVADAAMESMIVLTSSSDYMGLPLFLRGGIYDANLKADRAIRVSVDNKVNVSGVTAMNALKVVCDFSNAHGLLAQNITIRGGDRDVTGMKTHYDSQYDFMRIYGCGTAIDTIGSNFFSNIYIWGGIGQANRRTVGFSSTGPMQIYGNSFYLDSVVTGFKSPEASFISVGSMFWYSNGADLPDNADPYIYELPKVSTVMTPDIRATGTIDFHFNRASSSSCPVGKFGLNYQDSFNSHELLGSKNYDNQGRFVELGSFRALAAGEAVKLLHTDGPIRFSVQTTSLSVICRGRVDGSQMHDYEYKLGAGSFYWVKSTGGADLYFANDGASGFSFGMTMMGKFDGVNYGDSHFSDPATVASVVRLPASAVKMTPQVL